MEAENEPETAPKRAKKRSQAACGVAASHWATARPQARLVVEALGHIQADVLVSMDEFAEIELGEEARVAQLSVSELASWLGVNPSLLPERMLGLKRRGFVSPVGSASGGRSSGGGGSWNTWALTEEGARLAAWLRKEEP